MVLEPLRRGIAVVPTKCLDDGGMVLSRKGNPAGLPEVGSHIAAWDLPETRDHRTEPGIGTSREQRSVPFLIQGNRSVHIAAQSRQLTVDFAQPVQAVEGDLPRELERQTLQRGKNLPSLSHLLGAERGNSETASHVGVESALAGQPEERFPNRSPADPQLGRDGRIPDSAPRRSMRTKATSDSVNDQ